MAAAANAATSATCTAARSNDDELQEDGVLSDSQVSVAVYVRAAVGSLRTVATDSEPVHGAQVEHHALSNRSNHQ